MIKAKASEPSIKKILKATFPEYRKRDVFIKATKTVTLHDLNWSGGSKSKYRACSIDGHSNGRNIDMSFNPPWSNPYEGLTVPLPENCVVVQAGYFCGKPRTAYLYVHPSNMPKLLLEKHLN